MARTQFYVHPVRDQWEVSTDDSQSDTDLTAFDTKEQAIDAAILSAQNSHEEGRHARVMVKDTVEGDYRLERDFSEE